MVIKDLIKNKISLAGSELSTPKDIVHYVRVEHDLSISYQKAWRAREAALDETRGSSKDSYKMVAKFAYMLNLNNPGILIIYLTAYVIYLSLTDCCSLMSIFVMLIGSIVEYRLDVDGRFLYFFMALYASIAAWQHCRPVISIDETSMKNKYVVLF